jgi:preprotein translocase subunit YajC
MNLLANIAYAAGGAPQGGQEAQNPLFTFIFLGSLIAIVYFLMWRPQKVQQKKHAEMLQKLNKNDDVITQGGIHGTIVNVKPETFTLRIDDNTRIEISKGFVLGKKKDTQNK